MWKGYQGEGRSYRVVENQKLHRKPANSPYIANGP
jgi:hypothetical protein